MPGLFGHCPNGGGVSTLAQMVWGTYFEKNCPCSKGHILIFGGSEPLPGWFGALMQWKLKFKWVFACVKEGVKACQDALGHLSPSKRWFDKVAQIGPKIKCPRVPGWVRGGGCNRNLGNAQIEVAPFSWGLPLFVMLFWIIKMRDSIWRGIQRWKNVQIPQIYLCYFFFGCANFLAVHAQIS